jgi:hypothetical protein
MTLEERIKAMEAAANESRESWYEILEKIEVALVNDKKYDALALVRKYGKSRKDL